jgi:YD repeat-containing protein
VTYPSYTGYSSPQATYTYDAMGNMASVTDWLGNTVDFGHDGDGNLTSQLDAVSTSNPSGTSGTSYSYDGADLNTGTTSTMASSCTLTQGFSGSTGARDADGQVTYDSEQTTSGCPVQVYNYQRHYSYDDAGRVMYQGTVAQGSSTNNFDYDASGDPSTMSNHDSSGNLDTYTQTFDNAGEVTDQTPVSGSSGSASSYTYDTLGDQTQTTTGLSASTDGYNQIGQMVTSS